MLLFSPFIAILPIPNLIAPFFFSDLPLSSLTKAFTLVSKKQKHFCRQVLSFFMQYSSQMMWWWEHKQLTWASLGRATDSWFWYNVVIETELGRTAREGATFCEGSMSHDSHQ